MYRCAVGILIIIVIVVAGHKNVLFCNRFIRLYSFHDLLDREGSACFCGLGSVARDLVAVDRGGGVGRTALTACHGHRPMIAAVGCYVRRYRRVGCRCRGGIFSATSRWQAVADADDEGGILGVCGISRLLNRLRRSFKISAMRGCKDRCVSWGIHKIAVLDKRVLKRCIFCKAWRIQSAIGHHRPLSCSM